MSSPAAVRSPWLIALAVVAHVSAALYCIRSGAINPDEGFYAAAARAVWQGELPYRDFGYTQPPLLPYANGALMQVTGFGLLQQRAVNGLWAGLALVLAAGWVARRAGVVAAIVLGLGFSLTAPWMYFMHLGKTYALTGFITVLASWVWLEWPAGPRKSAVLALLGVIGTGCRLPAAPFFAFLWVAALAEQPRPDARRLLAAIGTLIVASGALLLPFYLAAPANTVFWVFDFHRISVPLKEWRLAWQEIVTLMPTLWIAVGGGVTLVALRRSTVTRPELVLAVAAFAALGANLLPAGVYEEYGTPFLLPLAMCAAAVLARARFPAAATVATLGAALALVTPAVLWRDFPARRFSASAWLTPNAPRFNQDLPHQLIRVRAALQHFSPGNAPLLGTNLILALETGKPVPARLRMGSFSLTTTLPPADAARLQLATAADIEAWLRDPALPVIAFFPQPQLNFGWSVPTFEPLPPELAARWLGIYRENFSVVHADGSFVLLARRTRPLENAP